MIFVITPADVIGATIVVLFVLVFGGIWFSDWRYHRERLQCKADDLCNNILDAVAKFLHVTKLSKQITVVLRISPVKFHGTPDQHSFSIGDSSVGNFHCILHDKRDAEITRAMVIKNFRKDGRITLVEKDVL